MKESETENPPATTVEDSDEPLAKEWDSLDWEHIEQQVGRMQRKISKAVMNGNLNDEIKVPSSTPPVLERVDDGLSRVR